MGGAKMYFLRIDLFWGGFICGIVAIIGLQLYTLWKYIVKGVPIPSVVEKTGIIQIPRHMLEVAEKMAKEKSARIKAASVSPNTKPSPPRTFENSLWANLVLQHLFLAVRETPKMRDRFEAWFERKISEMRQSLGSVKLRQYNLGTGAPVISEVSVVESLTELPNTRLTLACNFSYSGGIGMVLDVSLPLGIPATVALLVNSIQGRARLQISAGNPHADNPIERDGYWSLSFYDEPVLDITAESTLQGKQYTYLTNLIVNQVRRSFNRKYVLPAARARPILKDRLQLSHHARPQSLPFKRTDTDPLPEFEMATTNAIGDLTVRVERVTLSTRSGQNVYAVFTYRRLYSEDKHKTQAAKIERSVAGWEDEIFSISLSPECTTLTVEMFGRNKLSKDLKIAEGSVSLSELIPEITTSQHPVVRRVILLRPWTNQTAQKPIHSQSLGSVAANQNLLSEEVQEGGNTRPTSIIEDFEEEGGESEVEYLGGLSEEPSNLSATDVTTGGGPSGPSRSELRREETKFSQKSTLGSNDSTDSLWVPRRTKKISQSSSMICHFSFKPPLPRMRTKSCEADVTPDTLKVLTGHPSTLAAATLTTYHTSNQMYGSTQPPSPKRRFNPFRQSQIQPIEGEASTGGPFTSLLPTHQFSEVREFKFAACQTCLVKFAFGSVAVKCSGCGMSVHKAERCFGPVRALICPRNVPALSQRPKKGNSAEKLPEVESMTRLLGDSAPPIVVNSDQPVTQPQTAPDMFPEPAGTQDKHISLLVEEIQSQLLDALDSREKLTHLLSQIADVQREKIQEQMKSQQKFARNKSKGKGESSLTEAEHWHQCMQSIQVILETGELEKEKLNASIRFIDEQITKLTGLVLTCSRLLTGLET